MDLASTYDAIRAADPPTDVHHHLPRFRALVAELGPEPRVVELGVRSGVSTVAWLAELERTPEGRLWAVDPGSPPFQHPQMTYVRNWSTALATADQLPADADVVFIDTDHTYGLTVAELCRYAPMVAAREGALLLHDTNVATFEHHQAPGYAQQPPYPVGQAIDAWREEAAALQGIKVAGVDTYMDSNGLVVLWLAKMEVMRIELNTEDLSEEIGSRFPGLRAWDLDTGTMLFAYGGSDEDPPRDYAEAFARATALVDQAGGRVTSRRIRQDADELGDMEPPTETPHLFRSLTSTKAKTKAKTGDTSR